MTRRAAVDFDSFLQSACPALDLQWRKYRRRSARRRVMERMAELGLEEFGSYLSYLREHEEESADLADRMRVTVTRFFRDRDCWDRLGEEVLRPAIAGGGSPYRAWSAGCCGGEEPYTLVMLWRSLGDFREGGRRLEVTATDIDGSSLLRAAGGRYGHGSLREAPAALREKYFRKEGNLLAIDGSIVRAVNFEESSLMEHPAPTGQDLVLCRYLVFTYYRGARRLAAAQRLFSALRDGGVLFTGKKEGLGPAEKRLFEPVSPSCGLYRRRSVPRNGVF